MGSMWALCKKLVNGHGIFVTQIRVRVRVFSASYSTEQCNSDSKQSFTESYLMSNFGLSSKEAQSISRKVQFQSENLPNSVTVLLRSHGFTDTHILKLVKTCPELFNWTEKTILPKLNFFTSLGVSSIKLPSFLSSNPNVLKMSVEKRLLPFHEFLKDEFGLDDLKIAGTIKGAAWATRKDSIKILATNIALLNEHDVPKSNWVNLVSNSTAVLLRKPDLFVEKVNEVIRMGFDTKKVSFCDALRILSQLSKDKWENKVRTYSKYGWSENMFQMAFKKNPLCMGISEKNISRKMEFLVNKVGVNPVEISRCPTVLLFSMEKRVIPRCSVVKVLMLKGLLEKDFAISYVLTPTDKAFVNRFIDKYEEDVPELVNVFHGKIQFSEIPRFITG
ncbi:transcription termination factor MTERF15, mitochondrial-like [Impatiens glandulifera]|uniref:transcription termination factor MTERF15, mitochondrial-like n=1 Tax=Impatiens glandulifera TaxID=253017 RepID=UPI001FB08533|nr:transcription termination factor MTERF15, mitochondrial-like [Impatiens glandulifera]